MDRQPASSPSQQERRDAVEPPAISLPTGGGAVRGIGETFAANPAFGTGSMQVPIVTSPGRDGFGPALRISYDTGLGNGPFGIGWTLGLPTITRKTDLRPAALPGRRHVPGRRRGGPRAAPERRRRASSRRCAMDIASSSTARASRDCGHASSAGPTWSPARSIGAPSPPPTSRLFTAPPTRAGSQTLRLPVVSSVG